MSTKGFDYAKGTIGDGLCTRPCVRINSGTGPLLDESMRFSADARKRISKTGLRHHRLGSHRGVSNASNGGLPCGAHVARHSSIRGTHPPGDIVLPDRHPHRTQSRAGQHPVPGVLLVWHATALRMSPHNGPAWTDVRWAVLL